MLYNILDSLRLENDGEKLVLHEGGWLPTLVRSVVGTFLLLVGCLVLAVLARGGIRPIEPTHWFNWLAWAVVMFLASSVGVVPFTFGICYLALRDHFTIDPSARSVTAWRGLWCLPLRRRVHPFAAFREVAVRSRNVGVFANSWRLVVSLRGDVKLDLTSLDSVKDARRVAGEIARVVGLPVNEEFRA